MDATSYTDKEISCKGCGKTFIWSASGQAFFAEKEFTAPQRCRDCRAKLKASRNNDGDGYRS